MAQSYNRVVKYEPRSRKNSLHYRLVNAVVERKRLSRRKLEERRVVWDEIDERVQAYVPETATDAYLDSLRDQGQPQYTTIHVPWTHAVLMTAHTYLATTFLSRVPVHQFMGRHGESEDQVLGVEAIIDYQTHVGGILGAYYFWFYDAYKYGLGVVGTYWDECYSNVSRIDVVSETMFGVPLGSPRKVKKTERVLGYTGNRVYNIRPHDWLPDPRVPLSHFQQGEFCGRQVTFNVNNLHKGEAEGRYFNTKELIELAKARQRDPDRDPGVELAEIPDSDDMPWDMQRITEVGFIDGVEMVVELVPEQWGLGSSAIPEKWVFTVGLDEVLIGCRPLGEYHDKFPYQALESDFNAHSFANMSPLEQVKPLEDVLTWLINSHFYNVRRSLNNELVVDPARVEMQDLLDPLPGGIIRLKPSAYGTSPRDAIHQLQVADVTRAHLADSAVTIDMLQRLTGISDSMMGQIQQGGRKTATEVRTGAGFGISRMRTMAEFHSALGFAPLAQMLVQSTQQHLDVDRMYRVAGNMAGQEPFVQVGPDKIKGFFDFVPIDGTMPIDRYAQIALWKDILASMAVVPQVVQAYDLGKIFGWMAKLGGIKNLDQFRVQVASDEALMMANAAGQVVPIGGAGGPGESNRPELASGEAGGEEIPARVSRPRQSPGLGPTL